MLTVRRGRKAGRGWMPRTRGFGFKTDGHTLFTLVTQMTQTITGSPNCNTVRGELLRERKSSGYILFTFYY